MNKENYIQSKTSGFSKRPNQQQRGGNNPTSCKKKPVKTFRNTTNPPPTKKKVSFPCLQTIQDISNQI